MTSSRSDDNENNNNKSVDNISDNGDNEPFPEDVNGSDHMGSISESETSDYTSEDESFSPPRKILKKENQNQEVKQQPRKTRHTQRKVRQVQEQVEIQTAVQEEQKLYITWSKVTGNNSKIFEYTGTGCVQKFG